MRLALGVMETTLETEGVCDELRFRQRVEIVLKFLQRWLQLPTLGVGRRSRGQTSGFVPVTKNR